MKPTESEESAKTRELEETLLHFGRDVKGGLAILQRYLDCWPNIWATPKTRSIVLYKLTNCKSLCEFSATLLDLYNRLDYTCSGQKYDDEIIQQKLNVKQKIPEATQYEILAEWDNFDF